MEGNENIDFGMYLKFIIKESSPESHTDCYTIDILGNDVNYTWEHYGFPGADKIEKRLILPESRYHELLNFIKLKNINRDVTEIKPVSNLGVSTEIIMEITIENRKSSVSISGMYDDWKLRRTGNYCNIDNHLYFHHADRIVSMIKQTFV